MPDDLDDLLRRTMKSLDDQVPSGYFDALPNQTLARLEAGMQSTPGTSEQARAAAAAPPPAKRDEDSGLHDIRNLAQSTKQRISRRASTPPPDDVLAQTSGGWKAIALPEPAKMVALPSLEELPSKKEVLAKERASVPAGAVETPAPDARKPFSLPSAPKKSRAGLYIAGTLVAAAAGVVIFFQMNKQEDAKQANVAMNTAAAPAAPATTTPAAAPAAKEAPKVEPIAQPEPADPHAEGAGSAAVTGDVDGTPPPAETKPEPKAETKAVAPTKGSRGKKTNTKTIEKSASKLEETKPPPPPPDNKKVESGKKGSGSGENEPSFDDLLKQAGVDEKKKAEKPKLEKKELTQDDFKSGMSKVNVSKCYKGTQGNALVKLKIAPSGKITNITVNGVGKAEGDCVAAAVRGVSFPAWDGSPQSFTTTFLLAE